MRESERKAFANLLYALGETYNETVSKLRAQVYWRALNHLTLVQVRAAADTHVRASKFFPKPADLLEIINGSIEDRAELAWLHVVNEVRRVGYTGTPEWPDEATRRAALQMFGGWRQLCELLPATGPELLGHAKIFRLAFAAHARRDSAPPQERLPTREEATAALNALKTELVKRELPAPGLGDEEEESDGD